MNRDAVFAEARRTPLTRGAIAELAPRLDAASVIEHAPAALAAEGAHVATVLAAVLVTSGKKLDPAFARSLLPELDSIELFGPIAYAADGDFVELLLAFLDEARGSWEREALAVLLAADATAGKDVPKRLLVHTRRLARHEVEQEASVLVGAAALRLGDKDLLDLAATFVGRAKKAKKAIEETIVRAKRPIGEALADAVPRVIGGDYTVRRDGPEVGRNDPCPCGSGQKYKKCCANKPAKSASFEAPRIDEASLHPEQATFLRASEIALLDPKRIPERSLPYAYRRALSFRRWAIAEKLLEEIGRRRPKDEVQLRLEMLDEALSARNLAVVEDVAKKLPADRVPPALALDIACLAGAPDVLAKLDEAALVAVKNENEGVDAIELGLVLLRNFPALGILAARGALHEGRKNDSQMVLETIEDARDRLLLAPFEPWWDFYEAMVEEAGERKKTRAENDKRAALEKELRRARAETRGAAAEASQMKRRLEELDAALAAQRAGQQEQLDVAKPKAQADAPDKVVTLEEERKRLRVKVDELQRIVAQGQDERRELRKKLTEIEEAGPTSGDPSPSEDEAEEEDDERFEGESSERPRSILVPIYGERAAKALADLPAAVAEIVLDVVASLAAGAENAWGGVKKLTKLKNPVFSARAGIHHRILFAIDERRLDVLEVIHRRDLEQAVNRLARL